MFWTIILGLGVYSYVTSRSLVDSVINSIKVNRYRIVEISELKEFIYRAQIKWNKMVNDVDHNIKALNKDIESAQDIVKHLIDNLEENNREQVEALLKQLQKFKTIARAYHYIHNVESGSMVEDLENTCILVISDMRTVLNNVTTNIRMKIESTENQFVKNIENQLRNKVFIIIGSLLIAILISIIMTKALAKPIAVLVEGTNKISRGDYTFRINPLGKDEIGELGLAFNLMAVDLERSKNEIMNAKDYADSIIKSLMDMLFVLNPDGTIRTINNTTFRILGYTEKELINKSIADLIAEEEEGDEELQQQLIRDIVKFNSSIQEGLIKELKTYVKIKSGERIPVILSGSVLRDKNQQLIGVILSLKDARDSKLIKELKDTQFQLIQSGKLAALGEMSSGLAHEINNPLFLIKGFNNRIKAELSDYNKDAYEKIRDYVEEINGNSQRIMKIINHFREFSRQAEHDFTPISINDVVSRSFILLNEQLKLRSINIKQNLIAEDIKIMGSGNQLEQVFINIITNAKDAIENVHGANGGELIVCTRREGKSAIIEFTDNGTGVDEEKQQRIFDPFYTTKEVGKGTGLGLSISHGIVTNHKGQISCKSKLGEGTSFIVTLPLCRLCQDKIAQQKVWPKYYS